MITHMQKGWRHALRVWSCVQVGRQEGMGFSRYEQVLCAC